MQNQGKDLECTGSIISSKFIITAAHCMFYGGRKIEKSDLEIVIGASNLKDKRNSRRGVIKRKIKDFWLHDQYDQVHKSIDYDIAIVEVSEDIPFKVRRQTSIHNMELFLLRGRVAQGKSAATP